MFPTQIESNNGKKSKRALSKWQIYLKGCIPQQPKEAGMGEKVSACSVQYKILKEDPEKLDIIIDSIKKKEKHIEKHIEK